MIVGIETNKKYATAKKPAPRAIPFESDYEPPMEEQRGRHQRRLAAGMRESRLTGCRKHRAGT